MKLPARSPDLNAYAERFVRSIKSECLAQIIPLGERHLRTAVKEYTEHYHVERNHQGLNSELIEDRRGAAGQLVSWWWWHWWWFPFLRRDGYGVRTDSSETALL